MVREALQVTEVAIKLSALGIKNALALSLAYAKENPKVKGKTSLDRLLREGKELKIIGDTVEKALGLQRGQSSPQRDEAR